MTSPAQAAPASYSASIDSRYDFATTVARFKAVLVTRQIRLFAEIDQRAAAQDASMTLRPTRLFVFGNPKGGTPIMAAYPHAALELPLHAVVWEDDQHGVHIDYQDTAARLGALYGVPPELTAPVAQVPALIKAVAGQE